MSNIQTTELSERELDILKLVATGASNKVIAQKLYISSNTVKVHLRNIFIKINVTSRTEAALYAIRIGLVESAPGGDVIGEDESQKIDQGQVPEQEFSVTTSTQSTLKKGILSRWTLIIIIAGLIGFLFLGIRLSPGLAIFIKNTPTPQQPKNTSTPIPHWRSLAELPMARSDAALVAYENQIYTIGGLVQQGVFAGTDRFDPQSNSWSSLSPKPIPVYNARAAVINGLIYMPGGLTGIGNTKPINVLEIYDISTNQWSVGTPLPITLSSYGLVAFEGQLYVFGGWDGQNYLNSVFSYDPSDGTWQERKSMPTARAFAATAEAAGKVYVMGGINDAGQTDVNEVYTPSRDHDEINPWSSEFPVPEALKGIQAATIADTVYVFSDDAGKNKQNGLVYFPQTDTWQSLESPPNPLGDGFSMTSISTNLFFIGGKQNNIYSKQNLTYQAIITLSIPIIIK